MTWSVNLICPKIWHDLQGDLKEPLLELRPSGGLLKKVTNKKAIAKQFVQKNNQVLTEVKKKSMAGLHLFLMGV